jgi:hypothetical protein
MVDAIRVVARGDALLDLAVTRALAERISRFGPSRYWFCSPGGSPTPRPLNDEQEQGSSVLLFDDWSSLLRDPRNRLSHRRRSRVHEEVRRKHSVQRPPGTLWTATHGSVSRVVCAICRDFDGASRTRTGDLVGATRARAAREYKQPELRKEIERLRERRVTNTPPRVPDARRATSASLRQRNTLLLAENRRLRDQITELKAELAIAYGQRRAEL